ncbi:hypothetical protein B0H10DRAFT_1794882 [Mycena sp. CBHHK59/15]|nr:hypothetical protein B0H10DRAFT_1794882 [Mycena sp. CBHHK59/15]
MISQLLSPPTNIDKEKSFVVPGLHPSTYNVYALIPARVYHAAFGSKQNKWKYSGLHGSLMFGKDRGLKDSQSYWFRLLDDAGKTIWIFKIPEISFEYRIDKPFFHLFRGCSRRFGFLFYDDTEAASFAKTVISWTVHHHCRCLSFTFNDVLLKASAAGESSLSAIAAELPRSIRSRLASAAMGRISPSMISAPTANSFTHVAHVAAKNPSVVQTDDEADSPWTMILTDMPGHGKDHSTIFEQYDIADEFLKGLSSTDKKLSRMLCFQINEFYLIQDLAKAQKVRRKPSPKVSL